MSMMTRLAKETFQGWRGYILAIVLVALATWLKYLAQPNIIPADVPILYMLAIVPTAIFFGFGPSILVCILSLLAYDFFFISPLHEFSLLHMQNVPILVIFLLIGVLFSYLASNMRHKNLIASQEISARKQSEAELVKYKDHLEDLVKQRTGELEKAYLDIQDEISRCKKTEEALRESEQRLNAHLDFSPLAVIEFDAQFHVVRWSKEAEHMFGWSSREIMGRSISEMKWVYKDDADKVKQVSEGLSSGNNPRGLNVNRNYRKDGSIIWCEWYNSSFYDSSGKLSSVLSQVLDISERMKAEEEIKAQRQLLETVVTHIPVHVNLMGGKDLRIKLINQAYQEIAPGKQMIGKTLEELWPETGQDFSKLCRRVLETGETYHVEDELNMVSRSPESPPEPRYFSWSLYRVDMPGEDRQGILNISWETTQRKMNEEDLKRNNLELESANRELEAFSYSVSHDLRAPLRALDGFSEAVLAEFGDKLDETGKDYLKRVRKASQTMSQLIDDMLKLSRIVRADMHKDRVNLSDMATAIAKGLKEAGRQAEFIIAPEIVVTGDRQLLQILMRNLLENAWKYTGKCPDTRIEVGVTDQDGKKVYFIKDNGAGFNMLYADKLFQPFQRLHSDKEYPGTGIGLAIVQRVIAKHGGKIWAESEVGKGTTFYFTLE